MANSNSILNSVFLVLLLFSAEVNISIATSYRGLESMRKKIDSQEILREICSNLGKTLTETKRRVVLVDADRVAPGGPDPRHH
uniref:CLAVATA3/ESR (CLE)-related protein 6-like n=2 Tax=Nicotiana TaxID=4085 RepID=A0A1S4CG82_TOBAC|nr:PREDICTED: CLAVATA3/ESR (CLE)-related protein 6-like [Nicotiana sylvestris]XP_016500192.1 PREDICTED: CLAVATA3/ESR (CLE)-related protein 6-like [Nicotiana tabacum]